MDKLNAARKELEHARTALEKLAAAPDVDSLDQHWTSLLRHLERTWNKAVAQLKRSPKFQGWPERGHIEQLRSSDPLLAYLRFARGADEHGIDPIATKTPGAIGINPAEGTSMYIEEMTIRGGHIRIKSPNRLKIDVIAAKYTLSAVTNRGVQYPVPTTHLGEQLPGSDPVTLAKRGSDFYEAFLERAEQAFSR